MDKLDLQKVDLNDYSLTGAAECSIIFLHQPIVGASHSINDHLIFVVRDFILKGYSGKRGLNNAKEKLLGKTAEDLYKEFKNFQRDWRTKDEYFYSLNEQAQSLDSDWRETWKELNSVSYEFWLNAYPFEIPDHFSDEIKETILNDMDRAGIDHENFHDLISPSEILSTQEPDIYLNKLKLGEINLEDYVRKFWYLKSTWDGGELLTKDDVEKNLSDHGESNLNSEDVKRVHEELDSKLSPNVKHIVNLLRVCALGREERKAHLQKMNIIYTSIAKRIAEEYGLSLKLAKWAVYSDLSEGLDQDKLSQRAGESVAVTRLDSDIIDFYTGEEAIKFIEKNNREHSGEIRGTVASRGKAQGKVRIVVRYEDFPKFEEGEVLVTTMTRPEFVSLMKKAVAIVTDEGGLTSHAAIVSRELKKPCIVGTKIATEILKNGDLVEVDAEKGIIKILEKYD